MLSAVLQLSGVEQDTLGVFLLVVLRTFFSLLNLLMAVLFELSLVFITSLYQVHNHKPQTHCGDPLDQDFSSPAWEIP